MHTMTDPGRGIAAAECLFADLSLAALRRLIDASGDGRQNTCEVATAVARDTAVSHGLTVNGVPIACGEEPASKTGMPPTWSTAQAHFLSLPTATMRSPRPSGTS